MIGWTGPYEYRLAVQCRGVASKSFLWSTREATIDDIESALLSLPSATMASLLREFEPARHELEWDAVKKVRGDMCKALSDALDFGDGPEFAAMVATVRELVRENKRLESELKDEWRRGYEAAKEER